MLNTGRRGGKCGMSQNSLPSLSATLRSGTSSPSRLPWPWQHRALRLPQPPARMSSTYLSLQSLSIRWCSRTRCRKDTPSALSSPQHFAQECTDSLPGNTTLLRRNRQTEEHLLLEDFLVVLDWCGALGKRVLLTLDLWGDLSGSHDYIWPSYPSQGSEGELTTPTGGWEPELAEVKGGASCPASWELSSSHQTLNTSPLQ